MFTMKFEIDARSTDGGKTHQVRSCESYRVREGATFTEVVMSMLDGIEGVEIIGNGIDHYQRCFVMNEQGNTVHTIRPMAPSVLDQVKGQRLGAGASTAAPNT